MNPFTIAKDCRPFAAGIAEVTRTAFAARYGSGDAEAALIAALRAESAVVTERAAVLGNDVAGHILFSRVAVAPPTRAIAALAPVSVRTDLQGQGIGTALIRAGLDECRARGIDIVVVLGDPAYYARFGFTVEAGKHFASPFAGPHFQALALRDGTLTSGPWTLTYPRAFFQD